MDRGAYNDYDTGLLDDIFEEKCQLDHSATAGLKMVEISRSLTDSAEMVSVFRVVDSLDSNNAYQNTVQLDGEEFLKKCVHGSRARTKISRDSLELLRQTFVDSMWTVALVIFGPVSKVVQSLVVQKTGGRAESGLPVEHTHFDAVPVFNADAAADNADEYTRLLSQNNLFGSSADANNSPCVFAVIAVVLTRFVRRRFTLGDLLTVLKLSGERTDAKEHVEYAMCILVRFGFVIGFDADPGRMKSASACEEDRQIWMLDYAAFYNVALLVSVGDVPADPLVRPAQCVTVLRCPSCHSSYCFEAPDGSLPTLVGRRTFGIQACITQMHDSMLKAMNFVAHDCGAGGGSDWQLERFTIDREAFERSFDSEFMNINECMCEHYFARLQQHAEQYGRPSEQWDRWERVTQKVFREREETCGPSDGTFGLRCQSDECTQCCIDFDGEGKQQCSRHGSTELVHSGERLACVKRYPRLSTTRDCFVQYSRIHLKTDAGPVFISRTNLDAHREHVREFLVDTVGDSMRRVVEGVEASGKTTTLSRDDIITHLEL